MEVRNLFKENKGFVSLIGLLITMLIIGMLYYLVTNAANKTSSAETQDAISNPKAVLDNARKTVSDINKRQTDSVYDK